MSNAGNQSRQQIRAALQAKEAAEAKTTATRRELNIRLENIRSASSIHRERIARKADLLQSCEREVEMRKHALKLAVDRQRQMDLDLVAAPVLVKKADDEMADIRQQLIQLDQADNMAKAINLANQIKALQAKGFTVLGPDGEDVT